MKSSFIENKDVEMWIESGIVYVTFKPQITHVTLDFSKKYVKDRFKVINKITRPILVDINNTTSVDKDAREYLSSEEASKYICAGAILVNNLVAKLLGTLFLKINKPQFPTKLFTNKEKAIKWLSLFKNLN